MQAKILITGASGLLGGNLAKLAASEFDVFAAYNTHPVCIKDVSCFQTNFSFPESAGVVKRIQPDLIIHCAALTNIDHCEEDPKSAYENNVRASRHVADAARQFGAYMVHISTDCVFDGIKGDYKEEDTTGPINVYGRTKLEAEREVLSVCPGSCVVRTNIFGWNTIDKFSLAEWMIHKFKTQREFPGFRDVFFSPIFVNDLAGILFALYAKKFAGIIHVASRDAMTKLDFARTIAEVFGYDQGVIKSVSIHDVGLKAPRGHHMSLNVSKARILLGRDLPDVRGGLERMKSSRGQIHNDGASYA